MSLLWPEQIRIVLHPTQVALLRLANGRSRRILTKQIVSCIPGLNGTPPWRSALHALEAALPEFCTKKAEATVVLSNHFVRYALISHSDQVTTAEEEQALIQHHFTRIYGTASAHWHLSISSAARPDWPRLACAVDQELIEALRALFPSRKPVLRSIQPYLMAAFNQYRNRFPASTWLALVEDGVLCLARLEDKQWRVIKCIKIGDDWRRDLAIQLEREKFISGRETTDTASTVPVLVFAPEYPEPIDVTPAQSTEQSFQEFPVSILDPALWPEPAKPEEPVQAMALVG